MSSGPFHLDSDQDPGSTSVRCGVRLGGDQSCVEMIPLMTGLSHSSAASRATSSQVLIEFVLKCCPIESEFHDDIIK